MRRKWLPIRIWIAALLGLGALLAGCIDADDIEESTPTGDQGPGPGGSEARCPDGATNATNETATSAEAAGAFGAQRCPPGIVTDDEGADDY